MEDKTRELIREYLDNQPSIELMGRLMVWYGQLAVQADGKKEWPREASPELLGYITARIVEAMKHEWSSKYDHEAFFHGYEQGRYGIDQTVQNALTTLVGK